MGPTRLPRGGILSSPKKNHLDTPISNCFIIICFVWANLFSNKGARDCLLGGLFRLKLRKYGMWRERCGESIPILLPMRKRCGGHTALLHKSLWYTLSFHDIRLNLRSSMWGVAAKHFPSSWWVVTPRRFHLRYGVDRLVSIKQLVQWRAEGVKMFFCLGFA